MQGKQKGEKRKKSSPFPYCIFLKLVFAALQLDQGMILCSKLPTWSFLVDFLLTSRQVQNDRVSVLADNPNKNLVALNKFFLFYNPPATSTPKMENDI